MNSMEAGGEDGMVPAIARYERDFSSWMEKNVEIRGDWE